MYLVNMLFFIFICYKLSSSLYLDEQKDKCFNVHYLLLYFFPVSTLLDDHEQKTKDAQMDKEVFGDKDAEYACTYCGFLMTFCNVISHVVR